MIAAVVKRPDEPSNPGREPFTRSEPCRFCNAPETTYDPRVGHACRGCLTLARRVQRRLYRSRGRGVTRPKRSLESLVSQERRTIALAQNAEALGVTGEKPAIVDPGPDVTLWDTGAGPLLDQNAPWRP